MVRGMYIRALGDHAKRYIDEPRIVSVHCKDGTAANLAKLRSQIICHLIRTEVVSAVRQRQINIRDFDIRAKCRSSYMLAYRTMANANVCRSCSELEANLITKTVSGDHLVAHCQVPLIPCSAFRDLSGEAGTPGLSENTENQSHDFV